MTVKEKEQSILKDFEDLGDEMLIFDYMFSLASVTEWMDESRKTAGNKVPGCQSGVWMDAECKNHVIKVKCASDSLIVSGILALIMRIVDGAPCMEVADHRFELLEDTFLSEYLSEERVLGLKSVIDTIHERAKANRR